MPDTNELYRQILELRKMITGLPVNLSASAPAAPIYASIDAVDPGTGKYSWTQQFQKSDGTWVVGSLSGDADQYPAYEMNGFLYAIPGTIYELWHLGPCYTFDCQRKIVWGFLAEDIVGGGTAVCNLEGDIWDGITQFTLHSVTASASRDAFVIAEDLNGEFFPVWLDC